jgi:hypothetical protein
LPHPEKITATPNTANKNFFINILHSVVIIKRKTTGDKPVVL